MKTDNIAALEECEELGLCNQMQSALVMNLHDGQVYTFI
jgi:hypothetical protein